MQLTVTKDSCHSPWSCRFPCHAIAFLGFNRAAQPAATPFATILHTVSLLIVAREGRSWVNRFMFTMRSLEERYRNPPATLLAERKLSEISWWTNIAEEGYDMGTYKIKISLTRIQFVFFELAKNSIISFWAFVVKNKCMWVSELFFVQVEIEWSLKVRLPHEVWFRKNPLNP